MSDSKVICFTLDLIIIFNIAIMFKKYWADLIFFSYQILASRKTSKFSDTDKISDETKNLYRLEISYSSLLLTPNQGEIFKIKGFNKLGNKIDPGLINWQAEGGDINNAGKLIVASTAKGIFKVTATSVANNLSCSVIYEVIPKLTSIKITPPHQTVPAGESISFKLVGIDQTGDIVSIKMQPVWSTSIGEIDSTGKLVVNQPNQIAYISARISGLEANAIVNIKNNSQTVLLQETPPSVLDINPIYPEAKISTPSFSNCPSQNNSFPCSDNTFLSNEVIISSDSLAVTDSNCTSPEKYIIPVLDTNKINSNIEVSKLVALEIEAPDFIILKPGQEQVFIVNGIDQFGKYIYPGKIFWKAAGGKIDSQGRLIVENDAKGNFEITAISAHAKTSGYDSSRKLLLIKISFTIFSWIISQKKFIKDIASYFAQELFSLRIEADENLFSVSENNAIDYLNILISDSLKDWVIEAVVNIIIDYLDKFISLCFKEDFDPLVCSKYYIVLPELKKLVICPNNIHVRPRDTIDFQLIGLDQKGLKINIERKVSWRATGGHISDSGRLIIGLNSQGSFTVTATIANILDASTKYNVLAELRKIRIAPHTKTINPGNSIQFNVIGTDQSGKEISIEAPIIWKTTSGKIDLAGLLIVNDKNSIVRVKAIVSKLEAEAEVQVSIPNRINPSTPPDNLSPQKDPKTTTKKPNDDSYATSTKISLSDCKDTDLLDILQIDDIDLEEIDLEEIDLEKIDNYKNYGQYIYIEEGYLQRDFNYCNLSWFYKSQLFYDGYSEQDFSNYTDYLYYVDLRDHNSYRNN